MKETTHFGFKEVPVEEKTHRVRESSTAWLVVMI